MVVRLNNKTYDEQKFIKAGIQHRDIMFKDGSCPDEAIIQKFLDACESTPGVIGVHCKAGLGRTGSLIGMYVMKHYRMPPTEFIAWSRLCRPGCVIGPQQQYLCKMYPSILEQGEDSVVFNSLPREQKEYVKIVSTRQVDDERLEMNESDKKIMNEGEEGQANYLIESKNH